MISRALFTAGCVLLTGCQNMPPPYALPEQRTALPAFRPYRILRVADMGKDGFLRAVRDILPPAEGWSWTNANPAVRVDAKGAGSAKLLVDFAVPEATFRFTGPVTITFLVNENRLPSQRYDQPGERHLQLDLPRGWVREGENILGAEIDKVWTSPADGVKLGFILNRMGLSEE